MNNEVLDTINRMRAVTISREYGSGGGEIAARLARRLGWQLVDHGIVERVASELGTSREEAEVHDEHVGGAMSQAMNSLLFLNPAFMVDVPPATFFSDQMYRDALNKIVKAAADRGHVVIVGRGSQLILTGMRDVLHIRIIAPFEQRVAYVMQREGLDRQTAIARIRRKEHDRMSYLEHQYHHRPDDAHLYDLIVNTGRVDLDGAVDIISSTLQEVARELTVKTGELGPAIGVSRYPAPPADFSPSAR